MTQITSVEDFTARNNSILWTKSVFGALDRPEAAGGKLDCNSNWGGCFGQIELQRFRCLEKCTRKPGNKPRRHKCSLLIPAVENPADTVLTHVGLARGLFRSAQGCFARTWPRAASGNRRKFLQLR